MHIANITTKHITHLFDFARRSELIKKGVIEKKKQV